MLCVDPAPPVTEREAKAILSGYGVPVIEDPPLARALYAAVEIDEAIPPAHFEAVAKIIGFILGARAPSTARAPPMR